MVIPVTSFFNKKQPNQSVEHRPLLNSIPNSTSQNASRMGGFNQRYTDFWRKFKNSPELYGIINILVTDILGDRPTFRGAKGEPLGRNKQAEAQRMWRGNRMKETLRAILFDMFITGDGYGWKAKASSEERVRAVKEALRRYTLKLKESDYNSLLLKTVQDEDLKKPKKFDYIPSSTVFINSTPQDITGYTQVSQGMTIDFSPEEVLHFRLNTLDGNVQGFSPLQSLIRELALFYFVKGNMTSYLQNGGRPDVLFTMENAQPNSDAYNNFHEQLIAFKQLENRHGGLLGTGKVQVQDLTFGKNPDLEYQNLSLWVLSTMLFAFGIPISRVPFLIGKSATSGDSGGLAEAGYQSLIAEKQDEIEDILNFQFFEEFNITIRLTRSYKQNELREAQTLQQNADTISKMQFIYAKQGFQIKPSKINEILGVGMDDLEPLKEQILEFGNPGNDRQNIQPNREVEKEPDNLKRADTKRNVANSSAAKGLNV